MSIREPPFPPRITKVDNEWSIVLVLVFNLVFVLATNVLDKHMALRSCEGS